MSEIPVCLPEEPFLSACIAEADETLFQPVLDALRELGVRICYEKGAEETLIKRSEACLFLLTAAAVKDPAFRQRLTQQIGVRALIAVIRQPVLPPVVEAQLLSCRYQFFNRISAEQILRWLKKLPDLEPCLQLTPPPVQAEEKKPERVDEWELCCVRTGAKMRLLLGQTILIGRRIEECQFVVPDSVGISRKHAALRASETACLLTDLHASNGTRVNGMRLEPGTAAELRAGERFVLGTEVFTVQDIRKNK